MAENVARRSSPRTWIHNKIARIKTSWQSFRKWISTSRHNDVIGLVFATGNHIGNLQGPVEQDGFFGSISTGVLLLSLGFSLSIAVYFMKDYLFQPFQQLGLIGFIIIACGVMIWMIVKRDELGTPCDEEDENTGDELDDSFEMIYQRDCESHDGSDSDNDNDDEVETDIEEGEEETEGGNDLLDHLRKTIKEKLPIIGIGFFFLVGIYLDIITLLAHFHCMDIFKNYCIPFVYFWFVTDSLYHMFRLIFMSVAITFIIQFDGISFNRNSTTYYSLFTIAASTLVLWFDTLLHDFKQLFNHHDKVTDNCSYTANWKNISAPNTTVPSAPTIQDDYFIQCTNQSTGLYTISETLAPYFHPLTIEFSLLVGEQLAHLLFHIKDIDLDSNQDGDKDDGKVDETEEQDREITDEQQQPRPSTSQATDSDEVFDPGERTRLLHNFAGSRTPSSYYGSTMTRSASAHTIQSGIDHSEQANLLEQEQQDYSYRGVVPMSILVGIFLNLLFIVVAVLSFFTNIHDNVFITIYSSYRFFFYLTIVVCILKGFKKTIDFPSKLAPGGEGMHGNHRGLQLLVIISSMGCYIYAFLSLFALWKHFVQEKDKDPMDTIGEVAFMLDLLINHTAVYLQISFMIHANQVQCPDPEPENANTENETPTNDNQDGPSNNSPDAGATTGSSHATGGLNDEVTGAESSSEHQESGEGLDIQDTRSQAPVEVHNSDHREEQSQDGDSQDSDHGATASTNKELETIEQDDEEKTSQSGMLPTGTSPTDTTPSCTNQGTSIQDDQIRELDQDQQTQDESSTRSVGTSPKKKYISKKDHGQYCNILLYLALCNAFVWFVDSFIDVNNIHRTNPFQEKFGYSKDFWEAMTHITMPLVLFFRFTSCFILFGAYLDVRK